MRSLFTNFNFEQVSQRFGFFVRKLAKDLVSKKKMREIIFLSSITSQRRINIFASARLIRVSDKVTPDDYSAPKKVSFSDFENQLHVSLFKKMTLINCNLFPRKIASGSKHEIF